MIINVINLMSPVIKIISWIGRDPMLEDENFEKQHQRCLLMKSRYSNFIVYLFI